MNRKVAIPLVVLVIGHDTGHALDGLVCPAAFVQHIHFKQTGLYVLLINGLCLVDIGQAGDIVTLLFLENRQAQQQVDFIGG